MSTIAEELTRIQGAKAALATSIAAKGVEVPASTKVDGYAALVDQIAQGGGSGVKVLEGDFTLVTAANKFIIDHNLGVMPFFVNVWYTGDEYNTGAYTPLDCVMWYNSKFDSYLCAGSALNSSQVFGTGGVVACETTSPQGYSPFITTTQFQTWSMNSLRNFHAGSYRYKIYYYDN